MPDVETRRTRAAHRLPPALAILGAGLAYLLTLAAFALAFERPAPIGWVGFAIVATVVVAVTVTVGRFLSRSR